MRMISIICLTAVLFYGCGNNDTGMVKQDSDCGNETGKVNPSEVLVSVNGSLFTKQDMEELADFRVKFSQYMDPTQANVGERIKMATREIAVPSFIQGSLLESAYKKYISTTNIYLVSESTIRTDVEKKYVESKNGVRSFADFTNGLAQVGILGYFMKEFMKEVHTDFYIANVCSNYFPLGDLEIKDLREMIAESNKASVETNAAIKVMMSNVVERLKSGDDFWNLKAQYDMTPNDEQVDSLYQYLEGDFTDMPGVWDKLLSMNDGESTGIIDAQDSYHIYQRVKLIPKEKSESGEVALQLGRIFFRKAGVIDEYSDEELKEMFAPMRRSKILRFIMLEEYKVADIKYPNGTSYFTNKHFVNLTNDFTQTNLKIQKFKEKR